MNDPVPPSLPPSAHRTRDAVARALGVVAVLAVLAAGWLAWDTRVGVQSMESTSGGRLAELGAAAAQSKASLAQAQSALKDAQARIAELEAQLAER